MYQLRMFVQALPNLTRRQEQLIVESPGTGLIGVEDLIMIHTISSMPKSVELKQWPLISSTSRYRSPLAMQLYTHIYNVTRITYLQYFELF